MIYKKIMNFFCEVVGHMLLKYDINASSNISKIALLCNGMNIVEGRQDGQLT